jgi:putative ABC transport system ATP-binding protein
MMYAGLSSAERERRARRALELVGLASRASHTPLQLSGGQQQRVAIARALVNRPALLLADEPTGNLDSRTSLEIMAVLQTLNQHGITILLVTHEADIAAYAKRQITFRDGRVLSDERNAAPRDAASDLIRLRQQPEEAAARSQARIREEPQ